MSDQPAQTACCPHPMSQHGHDGCLDGWGNPINPSLGCQCRNPGLADA